MSKEIVMSTRFTPWLLVLAFAATAAADTFIVRLELGDGTTVEGTLLGWTEQGYRLSVDGAEVLYANDRVAGIRFLETPARPTPSPLPAAEPSAGSGAVTTEDEPATGAGAASNPRATPVDEPSEPADESPADAGGVALPPLPELVPDAGSGGGLRFPREPLAGDEQGLHVQVRSVDGVSTAEVYHDGELVYTGPGTTAEARSSSVNGVVTEQAFVDGKLVYSAGAAAEAPRDPRVRPPQLEDLLEEMRRMLPGIELPPLSGGSGAQSLSLESENGQLRVYLNGELVHDGPVEDRKKD